MIEGMPCAGHGPSGVCDSGPLAGRVARLRYQAETRGADRTVVIESGGNGRANR